VRDAWTVLLAETAARGVLFRRGGFAFVSAAHTEADVVFTGEAFAAALRHLRRALDAGSLGEEAARVPVEEGVR
jgi:glutamate-1-semialdehyde aminotransferase